MLSKLFGAEAKKAVTCDKEVLWDSDVDVLKSQIGERIVDAASQIIDIKGGDQKNPQGTEGSLSVTTLRVIFTSKKNAAINMSIGHRVVTRASLQIQDNSSTLLIAVHFNTSRFEMIFKSKGDTCPSCFHSVLKLYRAYDESHLYRLVSLRRPSMFTDGKLNLLPLEKVKRTINGCWNLSSDQGNLGVFVLTNLRLVWYCLLSPEFNVSIPWWGVDGEVTARNSKFGDCLVINVQTYVLGWLVDDYKTVAAFQGFVSEIKEHVANSLTSPVYGVDQYIDNLPDPQNPLLFEKKEPEKQAEYVEEEEGKRPAEGEDPGHAAANEQGAAVDSVSAPTGLEMSDADLDEAFKKGRKPWGRSKIMIVGEGRAGKTALANSIMGKNFEETSSTVGINLFTCDIKYAAVGNGQWNQHANPEKLLEAALAQMIADEKLKRRHKVVEGFELAGDIMKSAAGKAWASGEAAIGEIAENLFTSAVDNSMSSSEPAPAVEAVDFAPAVAMEMKGRVAPMHTVCDNKDEAPIDDSQFTAASSSAPVAASNKYINVEGEQAPGVNNDLVMKCLTDGIHTESKFIISLFDFGGQSVFNVIHPFFLTKYGVYIVTFNMEWLSEHADPVDRDHCLSYMTFWINSVVVHTKNDKDEVAPIVMVGTRKDKISDPAEHEAISTLLYETFSNSIAWPYVIENPGATGANGKSDLFFFPVDNTLGRNDEELQKMLSAVENVIDESEYVHAEQPLSWLQTLDKLKSRKESYVLYEEVVRIAKSCDVSSTMVPKLLFFLHEMGMVMWHGDEGLRDVIILDPINYFVQPATIVICKHVPKKNDAIYHSLDIHKKVKKKMKSEWDSMVMFGIVGENLLDALLESYSAHKERIVKLMLKYGLLVRIVSALLSDGASAEERSFEELLTSYMAPALLPDNDNETKSICFRKPWSHVKTSSSFYFAFSVSKTLFQKSSITLKNCQELGFLPSGLFERLICKAVGWCQDTSAGSIQSVDFSGLFKDEAVLYFGSQQFRLRLLGQYNVIEVLVEGDSPVAIHERLRDQVEKVIAECMKSLKFSTLLEYVPQGGGVDSLGDNAVFLRVHQLYSAMERRGTLAVHLNNGAREMIDAAEMAKTFGPWVQQFQIFDRYDIFLSYRWGNHDSAFVQCVFDRLTLFTVDSTHRSVVTFLDNHRLQMGRQIQGDLVRAIMNTHIVLPVVSSDALMRMKDHDPTVVDNVLLEWIIALNCYKHVDCIINKILPVLFGTRTEGVVGSLFNERTVDSLPDYQPTATMELAFSLLSEHRVSIKDDVRNLTVRDILNRLLQFMCVLAWKETENATLIARVAETLVEGLAEPLLNSVPDNGSALGDAATVSATASDPDPAPLRESPPAMDSSAAKEAEELIPLEKLSVEQVGYLLFHIDLAMYVADFKNNRVDGEALSLSETTDDLKEVGVSKGIHAKKILKLTSELKVSGVPVAKLVPPL